MHPPIPNQYQAPVPQPSAPPPYPYPYPIQPNIPPSMPAAKWATGLCDCCSDCSTCCMTCCCPCVTFGQIAEIIDRGSKPRVLSTVIYALICHFTGCPCIYASYYRSRMRKQYNLPESPCADFLVHCCCECCALCQEHRQLKSMGFDTQLGWRESLELQNQRPKMSPMVPGGMIR